MSAHRRQAHHSGAKIADRTASEARCGQYGLRYSLHVVAVMWLSIAPRCQSENYPAWPHAPSLRSRTCQATGRDAPHELNSGAHSAVAALGEAPLCNRQASSSRGLHGAELHVFFTFAVKRQPTARSAYPGVVIAASGRRGSPLPSGNRLRRFEVSRRDRATISGTSSRPTTSTITRLRMLTVVGMVVAALMSRP